MTTDNPVVKWLSHPIIVALVIAAAGGAVSFGIVRADVARMDERLERHSDRMDRLEKQNANLAVGIARLETMQEREEVRARERHTELRDQVAELRAAVVGR